MSAANILGSGLEVNSAVGLGKVAKDVGKAVIGKIGVNASKVVNDITKESVYLKLNNYLLDPTHKTGATKAQWFKEALGFTKTNADDLARQIKFDEKVAIKTELTQYGQKYEQIIPIVGANSKNIDVKFVWIKNKDGNIRLITAIPTKK